MTPLSFFARSTIVACASLLLLAGCGGGGGEAQKPAAEPSAASQPAGRLVEITSNDSMQFSLKEITAAPGEALRVSLHNVGKMPKAAMAHNWVLLVPMEESAVLGFAQSLATRAPSYLPEDMSKVLAHTRLLGPGERDEAVFNAPKEPGKYPFVCTFPGHAALMKGVLVVQ